MQTAKKTYFFQQFLGFLQGLLENPLEGKGFFKTYALPLLPLLLFVSMLIAGMIGFGFILYIYLISS